MSEKTNTRELTMDEMDKISGGSGKWGITGPYYNGGDTSNGNSANIYLCPHCTDSFTEKEDLEAHIRAMHS